MILIEAGDLSKVRDWSLDAGLYSNRVSSITSASQGFLKGAYSFSQFRYNSDTLFTDIGVWSDVAVDRTCPVEEMEV